MYQMNIFMLILLTCGQVSKKGKKHFWYGFLLEQTSWTAYTARVDLRMNTLDQESMQTAVET